MAKKIIQYSEMVDESNFYDLSRGIEKDVQRMIGRLKYR